MPTEDLYRLTALDIVRHYRARDLSPVEVADAVLARLEEVDGNLNAFCHRDDEAFRAAAVASEERWVAGSPLGPLDGVPTSVKDVLRIRGWPTRMGSKAVDARQPWTADAPAVARLRESGALFIGMTTTPEMGWKGVTDSPLYGQTRNPWNLRMTPGGSSGGAAAAVACGVGPLALGTDGGGSVRIPASFCGIVGFKPTFGRVAAWPPGLYGTLSHVGPMARTVSDAALLLDVIGKPDSRDPWSLADQGIDHLEETRSTVAGLRVAYSRDLGHVRVAHAVADVVDQAVRDLGDLGMEIEEIEFDIPKAEEAFRTLWYAAAAAAIRTQSRHRRRFLDYGLTKIAAEGEAIRAVDLVEAERARTRYATDVGALLERFDLLVTPTLPISAFEVGLEVPSGWPHERWYTWTPFTWPFNLTGQPALSVPCGFTADGLPVGLQIVARRQADALALRAGAAYQERFPTLSSWPTAGRASG
ncbi:MAG: amidase [bacterium]|nr:amidase [bacterium]MDE0242898.1 amidase [bacterium]MDE0418334.1 amidase [bacterium]